MKLQQLLATHRRYSRPRAVLAHNLGDGYLYRHNPVFRRVRDAALAAGFRFDQRDPDGYFGFPLIALPVVLAKRRIPFRNNVRGLEQLEATRPRFFRLADFDLNRPHPNYLLHEAAHGVAFQTVFGKPRDALRELRDPTNLPGLLLGESFAMAAEYLAACCVNGNEHRWFFSINSYRRRTQSKRAVGELVGEFGLGPVAASMILAFLYSNFLRDRLDRSTLARVMAASSLTRRLPLSSAIERRWRNALCELMQMSPEFRRNTSRLFLGSLGYARSVERVLSRDPLELLRAQPAFERWLNELARVLAGGRR